MSVDTFDYIDEPISMAPFSVDDGLAMPAMLDEEPMWLGSHGTASPGIRSMPTPDASTQLPSAPAAPPRPAPARPPTPAVSPSAPVAPPRSAVAPTPPGYGYPAQQPRPAAPPSLVTLASLLGNGNLPQPARQAPPTYGTTAYRPAGSMPSEQHRPAEPAGAGRFFGFIVLIVIIVIYVVLNNAGH